MWPMKSKTQRRCEYQQRVDKAKKQNALLYDIIHRNEKDIARWEKAIRKLGGV